MVLIEKLSSLLWGSGTVILILVCGLVFTFKFKVPQVTAFKEMVRLPFLNEKTKGGISSFAAMATALGGTMGVGNIIGVGSAIAIGGVGGVFWMWVSAFFGMATKYAENFYAVKYRCKDKNGNNIGGPMGYMTYGLNAKGLGKFFCILTAISSFGVGNAIQIGAMNESINNVVSLSPHALCVIIIGISIFIFLGGAERISKISAYLIPALSFLYVFFCGVIICLNIDKLGSALCEIVICAFKPSSAVGGAVGTTMMKALKTGVNHGVFSNEAGMGSSSIAHACGNGENPNTEGLWGMFEVFFDTVICCTLTALAIIVTGSHNNITEIGDITTNAFFSVFGKFGQGFIALSISLFAFATLISWYFYGEKSLEFLNIKPLKKLYLIMYIAVCGISCYFKFSSLLPICDILNGLTVLPNVICLLLIDKNLKLNYNIPIKKRENFTP